MKQLPFASLVLIVPLLFSTGVEAGRLDDVRERGVLRCAVSKQSPGFSVTDANNRWRGFHADFCRVLASAIFDDPEKVTFVPVAQGAGLAVLAEDGADVLMSNTPWTMAREIALGVRFPAATYYSGQGFMVRKELGVASALELSGATICLHSQTPNGRRAADFFSSRKMTVEFVPFKRRADAVKAYQGRQCNVCMDDLLELHASRAAMPEPDDQLILPEVASKQPLGPAVRAGDEQWFGIVRWSVYATIIAEELGVSADTLSTALSSQRPAIRKLLGVEGNYGRLIGLDRDWVVRIVRHVGNYAEIFDRNLGSGSVFKMERGLNALWRDGGLLFAPPMR